MREFTSVQSDDDDAFAVLEGADLSARLEAVHARHARIHEDGLRCEGASHVDSLESIARNAHVMAALTPAT